MTKEQLAKLGIVIEEDNIDDAKAQELINKKFSDMSADLNKNKNLLSQRNSEIAEYKRKEQEKLSEEEKRNLHYQELEEQNKKLNREIALNKKIAEYVGLGYDTELANKVAEAELDGKSTVAYHKQFINAREEQIKADLMKGNPNPQVDKTPKTLTKEDVAKMGYEDLLKLQKENPTVYAELTKKE